MHLIYLYVGYVYIHTSGHVFSVRDENPPWRLGTKCSAQNFISIDSSCCKWIPIVLQKPNKQILQRLLGLKIWTLTWHFCTFCKTADHPLGVTRTNMRILRIQEAYLTRNCIKKNTSTAPAWWFRRTPHWDLAFLQCKGSPCGVRNLFQNIAQTQP